MLLNSGSGSFGQALVSAVPFSAVYLAYADLNHAGKLDLAIAGSLNAIVLLFGNGDGTFQPPVYPMPREISKGSLGIVPFQDGSTLLVTSDQYTGSLLLMLLADDGSTGAHPLTTVGGMLPRLLPGT